MSTGWVSLKMRRNTIIIAALALVVSLLLVFSSSGVFHTDSLQEKADIPKQDVLNSPAVNSKLKFASYYGNHMVLQKNSSNIIWGYAHRKHIRQEVSLIVSGKGTASSTKTLINNLNVATGNRVYNMDGVWSFQIGPHDAGGPYTLTVSVEGSQASITDVMFGEVWVCSGQSNMEFTASMMFNASREIKKAAKYPNIRLLTIGMHVSNIPLYDFAGIEQEWAVASPTSVGGDNWTYFSAVCWEYGRHLYDKLKTPIGLIASSWGGTPIEAWSSVDALHQCKQKTDIGQKVVGPATHSVLYNAMIHPMLNLTLAGVVWYQGESNAGSLVYDCRFYAMINDWRLKFHIGSVGATDLVFPFGFVQLAPNQNVATVGQFPSLRWQQTMNYGYSPNPDLKRVFMAVTIDLPDFSSPFGSVHPRDKETVGLRLAKAGLGVAYGKITERYLGPFPTAFYVNYDIKTLQIEVDRNKSSLSIRNQAGFEVCCDNEIVCDENDKRWRAADIVSQDSLVNHVIAIRWNCNSSKIMGVRYLWSESPCPYLQCPVYSKDGYLPMPPFMFRGELIPGRMTTEGNNFINKVTIYNM